MPTRRETAHGVELAGGATAGAVGSVFGAAKLRDAYRDDYPAKFVRRVNHVPTAARVAGLSQQHGARLTRVLAAGKPGFRPLAVAVTAGSIATGAKRYGAHLDRKARKRTVAKNLGTLPRYARLANVPGRCRVLEYHGPHPTTGHPMFTVLDRTDTKHTVPQHRLTFLKEHSVSKSAFGVEDVRISKAVTPKPPKHHKVPTREWSPPPRKGALKQVTEERWEKNLQSEPVSKSDARMGTENAAFTGHLPQHTPGAVAAKKSAFQASIETPGNVRAVKPGLRKIKPLITRVVAKSAFGVEDDRVEKRNTNKHHASPERLATGALFPGVHGAVAGKKGKKLRAAGHELAGAAIGSVAPGPGTLAGGGVGTHFAHRKGLYKPDGGTQRKTVSKSAFGVEDERVAKAATSLVLANRKQPRHSSPGLYSSESNRHRRAGAASGALAAGSAALGVKSAKQRKVSRGHLADAGRHDVEAATHFADADGHHATAATRIAGHAKHSAGGVASKTGISPSRGEWASTIGAASRGRESTNAGYAANRALRSSLLSAGKASHRSGRLGAGAAVLGAAAVGVQAHGRRGGRSYGYR